jgi:UDP-glucose:(heptosyl)LPS alpha-1,3-glucosyltransferase
MKPISLALIRQRYAEDGGAERFVARLLEAIPSDAMRVTLITREWQDASGFDVVATRPFSIGRLWRDWSFARAVCRTVTRKHFDLVQSHERVACCDIYRAGDGVHSEWLVQRSRALGAIAAVALGLNPYHVYVCRAERRLFHSPRLRAVICNSHMVKEEIQQHFGLPEERLKVIYNGVDTARFTPELKRHRQEVRVRYGIDNNAYLFLFVGSGFERKGLAGAIDAIARVPDAHLLVVGRDKRLRAFQARAFKAGVAERVHFAGAQPDVTPYYGAADSLVLPTLYDPFPNVVLEALASGLPVVISRKCGAAELIREGENGFVCDALNTPALARAMKQMLPQEQQARMSAAARHTAESFSLERMTGEYLAFYRSVVAGQA